MPPLSLDFLHPVRQRRRAGAILLVAALAAAAGSVGRHQALISERDGLLVQTAEAKRTARRQLLPIEQTGDAKLTAQEVIRANAVLANLALPWDALFGELEAASNPNVALLSIQPESGGRRVRLVGEARRFEELLAYIARLEASAGFGNVFLTKHEMQAAGAEVAVGFTVAADWVGQP